MIARPSSGWQTMLADLSLILFMVTAAALSQAQLGRDGPSTVSPMSPTSEPLALYRVAPGSPPLTEWLSAQSADPRQQLTIVAQYGPGQQAEALQKAALLASEAHSAGMSARILVEPGKMGTSAGLAFDAPDSSLAQGLLDESHSLHPKDEP